MGRIWLPGGGGGADLDEVTAVAGDVIKGKVIVGPDGEPLTGTLELTGTAADSQVLSGKTYYNTDTKTKRTGTMANKGAVTGSVNCGGSYTIPAGYHNGSGKVTGNSLASQTGVQSGKTAAGAGQILTGYEAWVNGGRVTGTMANQGAKTAALNCGGSYTIPAGFHNGSGKVTANSLASQTDANAAAGDILSGKTAYVKGNKITGTISDQGQGQFGTQFNVAGSGDGAYYAIANIPQGYYHKSSANESWAPEAKILRTIARSSLGVSASKILQGQTIAEIEGTATSDATAASGDILSGKTAYVKGNKITGSMATLAGGTYTPKTDLQITISCANKKMTSDIIIDRIGTSYPGWTNKVGISCRIDTIAANSSGERSTEKAIQATGDNRILANTPTGYWFDENFAMMSVYGTISPKSGIGAYGYIVGSTLTSKGGGAATSKISTSTLTCVGFGKDSSNRIVGAKFEVTLGRTNSNGSIQAINVKNLTWVNNTPVDCYLKLGYAYTYYYKRTRG